MSITLTGQRIVDTYAQLLHLDSGVTTTSTTVRDGDGTESALKLSTTRVGAGSGSLLLQGGSDVTSSAAELNLLDGVTSTTAELNILDGVTSTAAELNILDGVTSTASELNILDGVTSTASELNILDGVTSTATELNLLDGVTSTTAELNIVDGDTSATSTTLANADRLILNDGGTMKQVAMTDFTNYFSSNLVSGDADIGVGTIEFSSASLPGTATASVLRYDGTDLYLGYSS
jgi:hypothetical protein